MPVAAVYLGDDRLSDPSWEDVKARLEQLDGDSNTEVLVGNLESNEYMLVSGGNDARYLVVVQTKASRYYHLVDPQLGAEPTRVKTGGMEDDYPARRIHSLKTAIAAAKMYYSTGKRDPRFEWLKE